MPVHFGIRIREKEGGLYLTRDNYAIINRKSSLQHGLIYQEEWCQKYREKCLENFDLNMEYFSLLKHNEFEAAILYFLEQHPKFKKVESLQPFDGVSGYYMMVLDHYQQVYIGTSKHIKQRIQSHWSKTKEFDRLLFPMWEVNQSLLSIDSFRAYDTTRIYACPAAELYTVEDLYINTIPIKFCSNRMAGGLIEGGLLQAITMMKQRPLINMPIEDKEEQSVEFYLKKIREDALARQEERERQEQGGYLSELKRGASLSYILKMIWSNFLNSVRSIFN